MESSSLLHNNGGSDTRSKCDKRIARFFTSIQSINTCLPTFTVVIFQLLSPLTTNSGDCGSTSYALTISLLVISAAAAFIFSFSDSFVADDGHVSYGFAVSKGLWVIYGRGIDPFESFEYRIKTIDFVHAILSVTVFATVALWNCNVMKCFFPSASSTESLLLASVPLLLTVVCAIVFAAFPTNRHGIGFAVTPLPAKISSRRT